MGLLAREWPARHVVFAVIPSAVDPHTVERACPSWTRWSALPDESQWLVKSLVALLGWAGLSGRGSRAALVGSSRGVPALRGGSGCGAAPRRGVGPGRVRWLGGGQAARGSGGG